MTQKPLHRNADRPSSIFGCVFRRTVTETGNSKVNACKCEYVNASRCECWRAYLPALANKPEVDARTPKTAPIQKHALSNGQSGHIRRSRPRRSDCARGSHGAHLDRCDPISGQGHRRLLSREPFQDALGGRPSAHRTWAEGRSIQVQEPDLAFTERHLVSVKHTI